MAPERGYTVRAAPDLHERWERGVAARAFDDLYEQEFPSVFRAAYALSGDREVAEDAAQEAFARALVRWRRLGSEPWAAGWVMTTALNLVRRQLRHRPLPGPSPASTDPRDLVDVRLAVHELPRRQQIAVVLHYLLGIPIADVARSMRCRPGTVKAHLAKARRGLAERLAEDESAGSRSTDG